MLPAAIYHSKLLYRVFTFNDELTEAEINMPTESYFLMVVYFVIVVLLFIGYFFVFLGGCCCPCLAIANIYAL